MKGHYFCFFSILSMQRVSSNLICPVHVYLYIYIFFRFCCHFSCSWPCKKIAFIILHMNICAWKFNKISGFYTIFVFPLNMMFFVLVYFNCLITASVEESHVVMVKHGQTFILGDIFYISAQPYFGLNLVHDRVI